MQEEGLGKIILENSELKPDQAYNLTLNGRRK
jgi:hypothetical protein